MTDGAKEKQRAEPWENEHRDQDDARGHMHTDRSCLDSKKEKKTLTEW